jgi:hypothetical protein
MARADDEAVSEEKQRRFHVGVGWQNDVVGRSLGHGGASMPASHDRDLSQKTRRNIKRAKRENERKTA